MKILIAFCFVVLLGAFALPLSCDAAGIVPCGGPGDPCTLCDIFALIKNILDVFLFPIVPIVASLLFAIGGFFLFAAAGNPQNLGRAKTIIFATIIGLLIVYGSFLFVGFLLERMGVAGWTGLGSWWQINCTIISSAPSLPSAVVLSGGPSSTDVIPVDDDLWVYINGTEVFKNNDFFASTLPPVSLTLKNGDKLRIVASDTVGVCRSIGPLHLHRVSDGSSQTLDAVGISFGCPTPPFPAQAGPGENFYDKTFTVNIP